MGRTPKPLALLCSPTIYGWDEVQALKAQGHLVEVFTEASLPFAQYDLILAPNGWYCDQQHRPYLDLAIKAARKKRYGPRSTLASAGKEGRYDGPTPHGIGDA